MKKTHSTFLITNEKDSHSTLLTTNEKDSHSTTVFGQINKYKWSPNLAIQIFSQVAAQTFSAFGFNMPMVVLYYSSVFVVHNGYVYASLLGAIY